MPHLSLTTPPLAIDVKRDLARNLTTSLLDIVRGHAPEHVTVAFHTTASEDLARAGTLVFDGAPADVYLRVSTPRIDGKTRAQLRTALSPHLVQALGLAPGEPPDLVIAFETYDPRDVTVVDRRLPRRRGGPGFVPVLLGLGLVAGVYLAIDRLARDDGPDVSDADVATNPRSPATIVTPGTATEATATMAAMRTSDAGEAVKAGQQDVRSSSSVAHDDA